MQLNLPFQNQLHKIFTEKYKTFFFKKDKLHEICPYTAMFPPKSANILINEFSKVCQTVYDPFSGRGATY
jgi:DNA modification methylase